MPVIGESSDYLSTTSMNYMEVANNYSSFLNVRGKLWSKEGFEFVNDMIGLIRDRTLCDTSFTYKKKKNATTVSANVPLSTFMITRIHLHFILKCDCCYYYTFNII